MKRLLDECIARKLAREFVGHEVKTVPQMGWAGTKNGQLLALAAAAFDVLSQSIVTYHLSKICRNLILQSLLCKHRPTVSPI